MPLDPTAAASKILHRSLHEQPLTIVSGSGATFRLSDGRDIIDASCGPAVTVLGHSRPDVAAAISEQANKVAYAYSGSQYTSAIVEELADILLEDRPGGLSKAIFVNSGSEATDAALKLCTQYWYEKGEHQRVNFIARKQSYHGNTIGALCVSGHRSRREMYGAWLSQNVTFVDPCYAYRGKLDHETDEDYVDRLKQQFEDEIHRLGPETVAGFIAEPISGSTLGCVPAVSGYFQAMQTVCDKYGILMILDEIMCGMGKTGTLHAWEQENIRGPDIQTIGKALGGGFVPLSGVLLHDKIFQALASGSGSLMHGHTFQAHPLACAGAVATQKAIKSEDLLTNVKRMGCVLERTLRSQLGDIKHVGDIRGRGLFWAVEFVKDKAGKVPFRESDRFCQRIVAASLGRSVGVLGNLGDTGEHYVDHVIVSPPYIVTEAEIIAIVTRLKEAVVEISASIDTGPQASSPKLDGNSITDAQLYIQSSEIQHGKHG